MVYKTVGNDTNLEGPLGVLVNREAKKRTVVSVTTEENRLGAAKLESDTDPKTSDYTWLGRNLLVTISKVPIGERFFRNGPIPADLAALNALGSLGQTTVWIEGEFVTLGDASTAHWDGTIWVVGAAPAVVLTGADAGSPGVFTPPGAPPPADLAALIVADPTADPATAWTTGQHVITDDSLLAHWDSADWTLGAAP